MNHYVGVPIKYHTYLNTCSSAPKDCEKKNRALKINSILRIYLQRKIKPPLIFVYMPQQTQARTRTHRSSRTTWPGTLLAHGGVIVAAVRVWPKQAFEDELIKGFVPTVHGKNLVQDNRHNIH